MTDNTRYALIDTSGKVFNMTSIGLIYEQVPSIAADGITVSYTETLVPTTIVPVPDMIQPGDKYVGGQFVRSKPSNPQFAVVRNRDNMLLMLTPDFGDGVQVIADPDGVVLVGVTTVVDGKLVNPVPPAAPAQEPPVAS